MELHNQATAHGKIVAAIVRSVLSVGFHRTSSDPHGRHGSRDVARHELVDERYGAVVERDRCHDAVCDVVGDDGGNDDTRCKSDDHRICDNQSPTASTRSPYVPTAAFLLGYLIVWVGFSVIATALQWLLQNLGLLTTMMQSSSYYWSAALFGAAGLYQTQPIEGDVPGPLPCARCLCPD